MRRASACARVRTSAVALVCWLGACAKKPVVAPAAAGRAEVPRLRLSGRAGRPRARRLATAHDSAWAELQAGDSEGGGTRVRRDPQARRPAFYPAEAGLGYTALARKDDGAALAHFDKALAANAAYAPALAGKGEALLAARPHRRGARGVRGRARGRSRPDAAARPRRRAQVPRRPAEHRQARARRPTPASSTRRGAATWRRSPRRPRARSSIASSPPSSTRRGDNPSALAHAAAGGRARSRRRARARC